MLSGSTDSTPYWELSDIKSIVPSLFKSILLTKSPVGVDTTNYFRIKQGFSNTGKLADYPNEYLTITDRSPGISHIS